MFVVRELTYTSMTIRIALSAFLGGCLGLERELKNRPAGLRTYMLVCLGACIIMITNQYVFQSYGVGDPVRMGAQVISGIGFLGAGTIIVTARNQIKGLTTAAGLWSAASIGLAIGIGLYEVAFLGGAAIFIVLTVLQKWNSFMRKKARYIDVYVELKSGCKLVEFLHELRNDKMEVNNLQMEHDFGSQVEVTTFIVTLKGKYRQNHNEIISSVKQISVVDYIEEL